MLLGRGFLPEEHVVGAPTVLVLSARIWRDAYGADRNIVGSAIQTSAGPLTVVGIASDVMDFPEGADAWGTFGVDAGSTAHFWDGVARLRPGTATEASTRDLDGVMRRLDESGATSARGRTFTVRPLLEAMIGDLRSTLTILFGATATLLLITCANVTNLLLARGSVRSKEVALRAALGAGRGRIMRQLLTESLVLAGAGAVVGLGLAWIGIRALQASGVQLPRGEGIGIDGTVLGFTLLATTATGLLFGLLSTLQLLRTDIRSLLNESSRGSSSGPGKGKVFQALVGLQLAMAVVLVIGSGLLVRSFASLSGTEPGFSSERVLTVELNVSQVTAPSSSGVARFYRETLDRIREIPGVEHASAAVAVPLSSAEAVGSFFLTSEVEGYPVELDLQGRSRFRPVAPDFFQVFGIPLGEGRDLEDRDRRDMPPVAVVNRTWVNSFTPDGSPLGRKVSSPSLPIMKDSTGVIHVPFDEYEVVGIVEDAHFASLDESDEPTMYVTMEQVTPRKMNLVVKLTTDDITSAVAGIREAVWAGDPMIPMDFRLHQDIVDESLGASRMTMLLLTLFGGVALTLAAVGIFGVVSFVASQRTTELSIRAALGATPGEVLSLLMKQGGTMVGLGIGAGVVGAIAARNLVASQLYEISASGPGRVRYRPGSSGTGGLGGVFLPARKVTKLNLAQTLRQE